MLCMVKTFAEEAGRGDDLLGYIAEDYNGKQELIDLIWAWQGLTGPVVPYDYPDVRLRTQSNRTERVGL